MSAMTSIERTEPALKADERTMLVAWLEYHRATLAFKCEGLTDDQLRQRSVPPSAMSLLGLVRHMAEVELNWFRFWLAGERPVPRYDDDEEWDVDGADVAEGFDYWRSECEHAREVLATFDSLDAVGADQPDDDKPNSGFSVRWVLVHMIEEYARHNGHADLLRETIDGATGD
jgi:uncharacterized damage-inducible protein DinB